MQRSPGQVEQYFKFIQAHNRISRPYLWHDLSLEEHFKHRKPAGAHQPTHSVSSRSGSEHSVAGDSAIKLFDVFSTLC